MDPPEGKRNSPTAAAAAGPARIGVAKAPATSQRPDEAAEQQQLHDRLQRIRHKVLVLSGKGGVGMSGFACPKCGEVTDIFKAGGGERLAAAMRVPFLERIPIDPAVGEAGDTGRPFMAQSVRSATAKALGRVVAPILALAECGDGTASGATVQPGFPPKEQRMRIAIPLANGRLSMHFGHCEAFAVIDVDSQTKAILKQEAIPAPEHEPGLLPRWLAERGATVIIAGGMGQRAQGLFTENGIKVVVGAPAGEPEALVRAYLEGTLATGANVCDH
jgi:predicted Fe-Mo cluster-binding NifX family protein